MPMVAVVVDVAVNIVGRPSSSEENVRRLFLLNRLRASYSKLSRSSSWR
jgi:hypothetical protein